MSRDLRQKQSLGDRGADDANTLITAMKAKPKFSRLVIYNLNCISKLNDNRNNLDAVADQGGFEASLEAMENHNGNPRVIKEGCDGLIKACRVDVHRERLGEMGGVEFCLTQLGRSNDSGSNEHTVDLLEALAGSPANITRLQEAGGLDILTKVLKDATGQGNARLAAGILRVMEKMTQDPDACQAMSQDTIAAIIDSLKELKTSGPVVEAALGVIVNLNKHRPDTMKMLQDMGAVKHVVAAMDQHPTNLAILKLGTAALEILSKESDLTNALRKIDSTRDVSELKQAIAMVGNLALVGDNIRFLDQKGALEKLVKIIKPLVKKLGKLSDEEKKMVGTGLRALGRFGNNEQTCDKFLKLGCLDIFEKSMTAEGSNEQLTIDAMIALNDAGQNKKVFNAALNHSVLASAVKSAKKYPDSKEVGLASAALYKTFGKDPKGMKIIEENGGITQMVKLMNDNKHDEAVLFSGLDAMAAFSTNSGQIKDDEMRAMVKAALQVLKENPENEYLCAAALKLLGEMAGNSDVARKELATFESQNVLTTLARETTFELLKAEVENVKKIVKSGKGPALGIVESLAEADRLSKNVKEDSQNQETFQEMYEHVERMAELVHSEDEQKKLMDSSDGLNRLRNVLENVSKSQESELKDNIVTNLSEILGTFLENPKYSLMLVDGNVVDCVMQSSVNGGPVMHDAASNVLRQLETRKAGLIAQMQDLIKRGGSPDELAKMYAALVALQEVQNRSPKDLDFGLTKNMKDGAAMAVGTISEHAADEDPKLVNASFDLLQTLSKHPDFFEYFAESGHIEELLKVIENNPNDEHLVSTIFSLLAPYGDSSPENAKKINDMKNWYMNRSLETDLDARKRHFLDTIYETMNEPGKEKEMGVAIENLQYCYDPQNDLVDVDAPPTEIDREVAKLVMHVLADPLASDAAKKQFAGFLQGMCEIPNMRQIYVDDGHLDSLTRMILSDPQKAKKASLLMALTPFMTEGGPEMHAAQQSMQALLLAMGNMDEEQQRNILLDEILQQMTDADGKSAMDITALQAIISLLNLQKTPEGKAKAVALLTAIAKSNEENAIAIANGEALKRVLHYQSEFKDNPQYAKSVAELMRVLAEYEKCVPELDAQKIDERMKELMFQYNDNMEIFHNAQRTIDLMNLTRLNMSPEELEKWKARARTKQLMTEFCRGLGVMISFVLTKAEREVRTGDTPQDISTEVRRILNEYGSSMDDAIEANAPTGMMVSLATAWLLRAFLMTYTFLVEKDISARAFENAPKNIEDTLVGICGWKPLWDFEHPDYEDQNMCVRGGIAHSSVRAMLDASLEPQQCQEIDPVTHEAIGREYTLGDLVRWAKMDSGERHTLRQFNLILGWIRINWNEVLITASMMAQRDKHGNYKKDLVYDDGEFLSRRLGLNWEWPKQVEPETFYFMKPNESYQPVGEIKRKPEQKGGLLIKVGVSGEQLRKKRREMKDKLDISSNVLTGDQKEEYDYFIDMGNQGMLMKKFHRGLRTNRLPDEVEVKFGQGEDGDLYLFWGKPTTPIDKMSFFNMKEVEAVEEGKITATFRKVDDSRAATDRCFSIEAAGDRELNLLAESQSDRDIWTRGLFLVLCTVAGRRTGDMVLREPPAE